MNTSQANIDDACAIAWIRLIDRPHVDATNETARGWLYVTAYHEALRLDGRDRFHQPEPAVEDPAHGHAPDPADIAQQRERLGLVERLPERQRRILWRHVVGFTYAEIAEQEGVSNTTTNKQVAKAKRKLRDAQADHEEG